VNQEKMINALASVINNHQNHVNPQAYIDRYTDELIRVAELRLERDRLIYQARNQVLGVDTDLP